MNSLLITGGAGFIGTNLVHHLAAVTDHRIVVLDALTYSGDLSGIGPLIKSGRIEFIEGDVAAPETVTHVFARHQVDRVIHLAAESHVDRSIADAEQFLRTNITGTYVLLEAARAAWPDKDPATTRFVHVSTDEVFGDLGAQDAPFGANDRYRPSSPYAASKASSDHLARAWQRTYGLPVMVTHCGNNYGPWQFPEKLIPLMILNAKDGAELPVYGDGRQIRDWIHVDDHCSALRYVLERGTPGHTYLIGANCERTNIGLVEQICDRVDQALQRPAGSARALIRHINDRPGHDQRYAVDASTTHALGWRAAHTPETAMAGVIEWYLDHDRWCENIRSGEYRGWYRSQYSS
ncbi:MAG: dTDP-glucose 4,6-dehydratase [Gammaproteobacteria bacterium]|nr:dTDP-glucose 4,6-dehydratase [Gammaproteobacteria bacterium]